MLAVRTPGAPRATRSVARPAIPPSPLRDRVGYSDHVRFRGYFPVHFIPAYNLPVYASRWPLPDTTQDSVRGCSLGFTAATISGDGDQRTCKAQTGSLEAVARLQFPQNVACGFPALRSSAGVSQHCRCYLFKFRFHGQLIFSLNRRPCLPLNGAHVAQEQFTCR
jgi:hypothetical protein